MTEGKGIQETKDALAFILALGDAIVKAEADGKIDASDLGLLMAVFPLAGPAFDKIGEVPAEFKDLSVAEAEELAAMVIAKLPNVGPKAGDIVNAALAAAVANYKLVKAIKG